MKRTKIKVDSEKAVQQKELHLTENNSEQQDQQEQQNETHQNQRIKIKPTMKGKTQTSESDVGSNDGCDPPYPDICITTYSQKAEPVPIYPSETLRSCHQIPTDLILIAMAWVAKDK